MTISDLKASIELQIAAGSTLIRVPVDVLRKLIKRAPL